MKLLPLVLLTSALLAACSTTPTTTTSTDPYANRTFGDAQSLEEKQRQDALQRNQAAQPLTGQCFPKLGDVGKPVPSPDCGK